METTVLFKRNINGKVMYWKGSVISAEGNVENCRLKYTYGELNTDNPIVTYSDKIEGKNIGKKNETMNLKVYIIVKLRKDINH